MIIFTLARIDKRFSDLGHLLYRVHTVWPWPWVVHLCTMTWWTSPGAGVQLGVTPNYKTAPTGLDAQLYALLVLVCATSLHCWRQEESDIDWQGRPWVDLRVVDLASSQCHYDILIHDYACILPQSHIFLLLEGCEALMAFGIACRKMAACSTSYTLITRCFLIS